MKKIWMASLALALCLTTAGYAQQTQGTSTPSTQRNTSSKTGLDRKGGKDVGTRGSTKMKDGVSRSGNSNLSPTSPTNAPAPGGDKPASPAGAVSAAQSPSVETKAPATAKPKGTGTRNGNTAPSGTRPMRTQGSTSEGTASVPSAGGAPGTGTKTVRSVKPKSRAAAMDAQAAQNQPTAAGQANTAKKTGSNGETSPGATNVRLTKEGQKEGSASDNAKRNKPGQQ
ncbi:hypothetical protein [Fibrella aquatica]|uniref:hypothetical protein n=1 Tax=Fibrella aquatica TaxID=3242487 RepID=UPI0035222C49